MILGIKTKKDKEIERLNKLVNTLIDTNKKNQEILKRYHQTHCKNIEEKVIQDNKIYEQEDTIELLKNKYERTEKLRRMAAGKAGGLMSKNHSLKEELKSQEDLNTQLKDLMRKREQDYLFVIRLLFNEIKFETHTRDYLRQKMKELKEKYPQEVKE